MFPDIEPFDTGMLKVSDIHKVYYEQSGNRTGKPVIFLHGGPGGGTSPRDRTWFDPAVYRIVLMDQRGAGQSTPPAELKENTTWDLVSDIEKLRTHLGIEKWVVFGGSWGSTLSLAYAETHPDRVKALILRGIFTLRRRELIWFYQDGASFIFPDAWEGYLKPIAEPKHMLWVLKRTVSMRRFFRAPKTYVKTYGREVDWFNQEGANFIYPDLWEVYLKPIPEVTMTAIKAWMGSKFIKIGPGSAELAALERLKNNVVERGDLISAYYRRLTSDDESVRTEAAKAWSTWEMATSRLIVDPENLKRAEADNWALQFARIECHYFVHGGFWETDRQLLNNVDKIRHIPMTIVQGRYDLVCPMDTAWELHKVLPDAEFHIIPDAGHSNKEPGTEAKLLEACEKYKDL